MTLGEILREHPDWKDLPVVVYCADGHYDYVGAAGDVYLDDEHIGDCGQPEAVVVFAPN